MILNQRVFHSISGSLTDISEAVNDFRAGTYVFPYLVGDYLYIGSLLPFNHLFIELAQPNVIDLMVPTPIPIPTIQIWWNTEWKNAVDVLDGTNGLLQNGKIQFTTDIDEGWSSQRRASDISALADLNIYNMFWMRISWDQPMDTATEVAYIGQKFSDDSILFSYFPDLAQTDLMEAFATGKTDWNEQHYMGAEEIVKDLIKRSIIKARGQILDPYLFRDASAYKVAEIIYRGMGRPYFEQMQDAFKRYESAMNIKYYNVDENADARLDEVERATSTGYMTR